MYFYCEQLFEKTCRCCGQINFERQKNARVSPFFAKYGLQIEVFIGLPKEIGLIGRIQQSNANLQLFAKPILRLFRLFSSPFKQTTFIPYGICRNCEFLAPWAEISNDQLLDYYTYYLSSSYKQARTNMERAYKNTVTAHGSREDFDMRQEDYNRFISEKLFALAESFDLKKIKMLDFGGGDSGVQPDQSVVDCTVYDVGEKERKSLAEGEQVFHFVQALHVFEHVGHPLKSFEILWEKCISGGLIYVEVPMEHPGLNSSNSLNVPYVCDEHINKFTIKSISKMAATSGGQIELVIQDSIRTIHRGQTEIIRLLMRKT